MTSTLPLVWLLVFFMCIFMILLILESHRSSHLPPRSVADVIYGFGLSSFFLLYGEFNRNLKTVLTFIRCLWIDSCNFEDFEPEIIMTNWKAPPVGQYTAVRHNRYVHCPLKFKFRRSVYADQHAVSPQSNSNFPRLRNAVLMITATFWGDGVSVFPPCFSWFVFSYLSSR